MILSEHDLLVLNQQLTLMLNAAPETLFNATSAQELSRVAVSTGFTPTRGQFIERVKERPHTTLLQWIIHLGTL